MGHNASKNKKIHHLYGNDRRNPSLNQKRDWKQQGGGKTTFSKTIPKNAFEQDFLIHGRPQKEANNFQTSSFFAEFRNKQLFLHLEQVDQSDFNYYYFKVLYNFQAKHLNERVWHLKFTFNK